MHDDALFFFDFDIFAVVWCMFELGKVMRQLEKKVTRPRSMHNILQHTVTPSVFPFV